MKNQVKLIGSSLFGAGLLLVAAAYGQTSGTTGAAGTQPGVLGPCPAPSASASAAPSATASGSPSTSASGAPQQCITVSIPANAAGMGTAAYGTNPLVIPPGTTVTWVNNDTVSHTATSDAGVFDSGSLAAGQSFSFTFNDAGSFPYHCAIHGAASMSGDIEVQSASPSPSPSATPAATATAAATPSATATPAASSSPSGGQAAGQAAGQAGGTQSAAQGPTSSASAGTGYSY